MSLLKGIAASNKYVAKNFANSLTCRQLSTAVGLVDIVRNDKTGIATVSMNRKPVNSLNLELLTELTYSFRELEKSKCRGIILSSSQPTVFSAGLDLFEMYKRDRKYVHTFWRAVQEVCSTLYGTGLPTAAAINGSCVAAGCLLALCCDYRVFVEGRYKMGINDVMVGIVVPEWAQETMINTIGHRHTEISLTRGSMFVPEDALKIGLVDGLASDKEDAIVKCENYLASCAKVPPEAKGTTKRSLRRKVLKWLEENQDLDAKIFLDGLEQPEAKKAMDNYLMAMKKKSQSKN